MSTPASHRTLISVIFAICLIVGSIIILKMHVAAYSNGVSSGDTQAATESLSSLRTNIDSIINNFPDDIVGVSYINLSNHSQQNYGSDESFFGASSTKVIQAMDYLDQVQTGQATLGQQLDSAGDSAQALLRQLITESNVEASDDAWYDFFDYLTYGQVTTYGQSLGLSSFDAYGNTITPGDEARALADLYESNALDKHYSAMILAYMRNADDDSLITGALPNGATAYTKYGFLDGELNDVAIVKNGSHAFVLVIFTNNSSGTLDDLTSRQDLFHQLTSTIMHYEMST